MTWSARQYLAFEDDRTRPVRDLLAAVPTQAVKRAVDLGCGPGNSTEVLLAGFPDAVVSGIDSSPDMIAAAKRRLPAIMFEVHSIEQWTPVERYDVILANAVLQWLQNHDTLLPRLLAQLGAGGSLAVQMPDNLDEPAHVLMREVAANGPWSAKLQAASATRAPRHSAEWYYGVLRPHCARVDIWRTTYCHVLPGGPDAVVEWFKGSGLRPFLDPLDATEQMAFLERYKDGIAGAYPALADGSVLLPFPRLFMVATT